MKIEEVKEIFETALESGKYNLKEKDLKTVFSDASKLAAHRNEEINKVRFMEALNLRSFDFENELANPHLDFTFYNEDGNPYWAEIIESDVSIKKTLEPANELIAKTIKKYNTLSPYCQNMIRKYTKNKNMDFKDVLHILNNFDILRNKEKESELIDLSYAIKMYKD